MHSRTKEGAANGSERAKGVLSTQSNEQKKIFSLKTKSIPNLITESLQRTRKILSKLLKLTNKDIRTAPLLVSLSQNKEAHVNLKWVESILTFQVFIFKTWAQILTQAQGVLTKTENLSQHTNHSHVDGGQVQGEGGRLREGHPFQRHNGTSSLI